MTKRQRGIIQIGFRKVGIFDHKTQKAIWQNSGLIVVKGRLSLGQGCRVSNIGSIEFGNNFKISANSTIYCRKHIVFGDDCLLSWDVLVMDNDSHNIYDNKKNLINEDRKIEISNRVWIGCRTTILKGTFIGENNVVAAGSIIHGKNEIRNAIITGNSKIIKQSIQWFDFD